MERVSQRAHYETAGIGRWYWDFRDNEILKRIDGKGLSIMDFGCGEGIILEKIVAKLPDATVCGIDVDSGSVVVCNDRGLTAGPGNVYETGFKDASMDYIVFTEVIEHLAFPRLAVLEIRRVLKSSGVAIVLFPNDLNFFLARLICGKWKQAFRDPGHVARYRPKTVVRMFRNLGFIVSEVCNLPINGLPWWASLHCLVVAQKP